jgi:Flp pilus assembly protein TadG
MTNISRNVKKGRMRGHSICPDACHLVRPLNERGVALWEFALVLPIVLFIALGVFDFGKLIYFSIEVESAARAAAMFGAQNAGEAITNAAGITQAAYTEAPDIKTSGCGTGQSPGTACFLGNGAGAFVATGNTAYYGCECPDGTDVKSASTSCTNCSGGQHEVYWVAVQTQATYKPFFPWNNIAFTGLPSSYNVSGYAKIRLGAQ